MLNLNELKGGNMYFNMEEQITNEQEEDWRIDVSGEPKETLKIQDGEQISFSFLNEGKKNNHPDFGESIVFTVGHKSKGEDKPLEKNWYVNPKNYELLRQIKELGSLKDLKVIVGRTGSKKSDTRYVIAVEEDTQIRMSDEEQEHQEESDKDKDDAVKESDKEEVTE